MTHLGTSLAQHTCVQTQPYLQSPTLQKEESREKGGVPDIIYPTPLITKHVKFSGKVRIPLCVCVCVCACVGGGVFVFVYVCMYVCGMIIIVLKIISKGEIDNLMDEMEKRMKSY